MLVIRARIYKTFDRIANMEDLDQTASSKAVWSGSVQSVMTLFGRQLVLEILEQLL